MTTQTHMPTTTPEAYKKMTPSQRKTFDRKVEQAIQELEVRIQKRQQEQKNTLTAGLIALVSSLPHIEYEIVRNFCRRTGHLLIEK